MRKVSGTIKRGLSRLTHRLYSMPVLILMPHSRCNCRCVMCDIWKANREGREISLELLAGHREDMRRLGVCWVLLSGGEPLMHSNLWALCAMLKALPAKITLLSTGLLLAREAAQVARWCDEAIISLDGPRAIHDEIRGAPGAFDRLAEGVLALRRIDPRFRVGGRCVLQRLNYRDLPALIDAARALRLNQISFLAADVSSTAFKRAEDLNLESAREVALTPEQVLEFDLILERTFKTHAEAFRSGFIAESPEKLRRLPRYYRALNGEGPFPETTCNAPWVSAVIEADGSVRPCFFHPALGQIKRQPLKEILNSEQAVRFRRELDVRKDPICRRCVCSLNLP